MKMRKRFLGILLSLVMVLGLMPSMSLTALASPPGVNNPGILYPIGPIVIKTSGSISYTATSVSKTYGDAVFTNELDKTGDGTVSYESNNTNVATVNSSTGAVTIAGAGVATVTATVTDSNNWTYATKTASYTVTVNKGDNPLTYTETQSVNKTFSTSSQTATLASATNGQGAVSYAINSQKNTLNADVTYFSLDGTTLTLAANTPAGSYSVIVRATAAGNDNYNSGTKDSTVTVNVSTADNPVTYAEKQAVTKTFSTAAQTATLEAAKEAQGELSYGIKSQKSGEEAVNYFTLDGTTMTLAANTPVGTYTVVVYARAAGNGNFFNGIRESTVTVTVNKADPTVTAPTAKTLTYTGSAQALVNAGSATGGTLYYALTTEDKAPTDEKLYTTSIPTATNAGT